MELSYDIFLGSQKIGTAVVKRQGLYYRFHCECQLSGQVIYKIVVSCDGRKESLGICVPENGCFKVESRVPVKRLGEGTLSFRAVPKHAQLPGRFIPIRSEEPFMYISQLQTARLRRHGEQIGIELEESPIEF